MEGGGEKTHNIKMATSEPVILMATSCCTNRVRVCVCACGRWRSCKDGERQLNQPVSARQQADD